MQDNSRFNIVFSGPSITHNGKQTAFFWKSSIYIYKKQKTITTLHSKNRRPLFGTLRSFGLAWKHIHHVKDHHIKNPELSVSRNKTYCTITMVSTDP